MSDANVRLLIMACALVALAIVQVVALAAHASLQLPSVVNSLVALGALGVGLRNGGAK